MISFWMWVKIGVSAVLSVTMLGCAMMVKIDGSVDEVMMVDEGDEVEA
jgi:hypothetical protein